MCFQLADENRHRDGKPTVGNVAAGVVHLVSRFNKVDMGLVKPTKAKLAAENSIFLAVPREQVERSRTF
jgi:hypothetical protein